MSGSESDFSEVQQLQQSASTMSTNGITNNGGLKQAKAAVDGREDLDSPGIKVWRLVLTGGPCGGKTTAQV